MQAGQRFQAITLLGSGSIQISRVGFIQAFAWILRMTRGQARSPAVTPTWTGLANRRAHVNTCSVPVGSVPPSDEATPRGLVVYGCESTGYRPGNNWTDYTASFDIEILQNEATWLVRSGGAFNGMRTPR